MKASIKRRWEERCREMDESQHSLGLLRTAEGKRCFLGVLTDLALEDGIIEEVPYSVSLTGLKDVNSCHGVSNASLSPAIKEWAGLVFSTPIINNYRTQYVWKLNDNIGMTFKEFAVLLHKTKAKDII